MAPRRGSRTTNVDREVLDDVVLGGRIRLARSEADPPVRILVDERFAERNVAEGRLPGGPDRALGRAAPKAQLQRVTGRQRSQGRLQIGPKAGQLDVAERVDVDDAGVELAIDDL